MSDDDFSRNIPMEVVDIRFDKYDEINGYICPFCGSAYYIAVFIHNYCPKCGQKLK